jgi:16S rRNA (cytosine1402-N4)-methyltransferase
LKHQSVLLEEAVKGLNIKSDGIYVDLTFGRGGHSAEILRQLGPTGKLLAIDRDPIAIAAARARAEFQDPRFVIEHANFSQLEELVIKYGWQQQIAGVLMDLGVSSPQLDEAERGFSFIRNGPLDMRMNPTTGLSAAGWVNEASENDLAYVFKRYGEEKFNRRIARAIVAQRSEQRLQTTTDLVACIEGVIRFREKHKHPATRVFQAIRIYINDELGELETVLHQSLEQLSVGGRMSVISFHSLEDRIAKKFIQRHAQGDPYPAHVPIKAKDISRRLKKVGALIRPSEEEVKHNTRARSAKLRIAEKLA